MVVQVKQDRGNPEDDSTPIQIQLDRRVRMTMKLRPIKSKVKSPLKITKLFQFSIVFNDCCLLLFAATTFEI